MNLFRKGLYILSWIPVILLHTFPLVLVVVFTDYSLWWSFLPVGLVFLGLVVVPIALRFDKWPRVFWLWGNDEEGCPGWWHGSEFWWYAIRNPVNNFRYLFDEPTEFDGITNAPGGLEARELLAQGVTWGARWVWSGPFAGYRRAWITDEGKYSEFWIGWKVGSTVPGMGFTLQLRLNRGIGT